MFTFQRETKNQIKHENSAMEFNAVLIVLNLQNTSLKKMLVEATGNQNFDTGNLSNSIDEKIMRALVHVRSKTIVIRTV